MRRRGRRGRGRGRRGPATPRPPPRRPRRRACAAPSTGPAWRGARRGSRQQSARADERMAHEIVRRAGMDPYSTTESIQGGGERPPDSGTTDPHATTSASGSLSSPGGPAISFHPSMPTPDDSELARVIERRRQQRRQDASTTTDASGGDGGAH